jgi:4-hydroxy-2-oxoglutarate aldolase
VKAGGLGGVLAPLTTPFDEQTGDVAPVALRQVARALLDSGLDGLATSGSTGEGELLADEERVRVVEWLRDVVPADRWLIAGAGAESTRAAIRSGREAAAAGADALLVRPPAYYGSLLSPAALSGHYARLADESPVPVIVYNIPRYTHVMLHEGVIRTLAEHPRVLGFKESSGDLKVLAAYRDAAPGLTALVGAGHLFYAGLELGASGGILAMACFAAAACVRLLEAFRAGDKVLAGSLQERLSAPAREIVGGMGPAGIKAAMECVGLFGGPVRAPLGAADARQRARIAELLGGAGLLAAA